MPYKLLRSTTQGGPYTQVSGAGALTPATFTDTGLTNGTTYYYVVRNILNGVESANSNEANARPIAQTSGAVTKTHPLMRAQWNADMTFASHAQIVHVEASSPGVQNTRINSLSESAGLVHNGRALIKKVVRQVPHLGVNRNFIRLSVYDGMVPYQNGSIRMTIGTEYTTAFLPSESWWQADAFIPDASMMQGMGGLGGLDNNMRDFHDAVGQPHPAVIPIAFYLDPLTSTTARLAFDVRRHTSNNAAVGSSTTERIAMPDLYNNVRAGHLYEVLQNFALAWIDPPTQSGFFRAWLAEDGVLLNGGNPIINYTGRVGYNLANYSHEARLIGHYWWRGPSQWNGVAVNNIPNTGDTGSFLDVRKSCVIKGGTAGGVTVSRDSLLGYLRLVE